MNVAAIVPSPATPVTLDGGRPARRAIVRWSWRLFRREWRQQVLLLGLIGLTVAVALVFATTTFAVAERATAADFGTANHALLLEDLSPAAVQSTVEAAEDWFGALDAITHHAVPIRGAAETVDFRGQDPNGAHGAPMLALRAGRYPKTPTEVAVTSGLAADFGLELGGTLDVDGTSRPVVGVVENPNDLHDDFALLAPGADPAPDFARLLVDAERSRVQEFRAPQYPNPIVEGRDGGGDAAIAAITILAVTAVVMVLVALVASAGFVVMAQRRLRHIGVLGAVGASERSLRLVMTASGAVVGVVGAALGAAAGLAAWLGLQSRLERASGFRLDPFDVPWPLLGAIVVLAVGASTLAASWPARAAARIPVVRALSGRPPRPAPVHRSTALAAALVGAGVVALSSAGELADETQVYWSNVLRVGAGVIATIGGVLMLCPLVVRVLGSSARRLPFSARLALRDLARYQARSAAALAALSIALGIAVAVVALAAAAEHGQHVGNLPSHQLLVRDPDVEGPFVPAAAAAAHAAGIDRILEATDGATAVPLVVALDPGVPPEDGVRGRPAVTVAERVDGGWRDVSLVYVATPEVIAAAGSSLEAATIGTDIVTAAPGTLRLLGTAADRTSGGPSSNGVEPEPLPGGADSTAGYTSLPTSFISEEGLRARGWMAVPSGRWLIDTDGPVTPEQLGLAREAAARVGLEVETRDEQAGLTTLRFGATAVGMTLALGVLMLTVGLIRSEAAADIRTLTAAGASSTTRRNLTAFTAAGLALGGVVLGAAAAYLVLGAGFHSTADLTPVPVVELILLVVGTPLLAAAAGWILAGREPAAMARNAID